MASDDHTYFEQRPRRQYRARYATVDERAAARIPAGRIAIAYIARQAALIGLPPIVIAPQQPKSEDRLAHMKDARIKGIYDWHVARQAGDAALRAAAAEGRALEGAPRSYRRSPARGG